jgi:aminoglycoside phosphotransferase
MLKPFLDELSTFALSLSEGEHKLFSPPFHWVCLANGDADFHDNVIFFGFDGRQTDPVLVAKVPRLVKNGWMLKTEYDHLVDLWNCIGEEAVKYVPKPYALTSLQESPVLMISYVPGESLTRLSRKSFWGDSGKVLALAREASQTLHDLNCLTESPLEHEEFPRPDFRTKADKFRELFRLNAHEDRALSELVTTVNERSKSASHKVLIQGDFWHGNMIRDKKRRTLMFVDWQFAGWSVDVSLDVYFFLLAGALSATESGPVEERAKSAFLLLRDWRANVMPEYLAVYGQPDHYVLLPQKYGMLLCCVEKAVRSALEFGYRHSDDLLWRNLFAELLQWPAED